MSSLVDTLTASGGNESAGFINDIVAQLWPHINIAAAKIAKDVVEPILASTLPGPLSSLRFVKLDLGPVPIRFFNVDVHKPTNEAIKLDMDVDWQGECDIELDGKNVPKIGIERAHLRGRLTILLCPLTNIIPLIGAAQIAFINPPSLKLDFTDAASIADCFLIEKAVRKTILGIISGMAVLPNRYLVKLDANNDYFKTYLHHHGVLRLTIEKATGIAVPKKSGASKLLAKIIKDVPDCFCEVTVGAESTWKSSTKKDSYEPEWNETHDFLVADYEQAIQFDVDDDDFAGDDDIGIATTTVKQILLNGGSQELPLFHKNESTGALLTVHAKFYNFVADAALLSPENSQSDGQIHGLVTVLVASALGLPGQRDELNPSVKVTWGDVEFVTATKTYTPGMDIFNPSFDQAFRIPITSTMIDNPPDLKIALLNKKDETGSVQIPFSDVLNAPGLVVESNFDVGSGAVVRARISCHGLQVVQ